MVMDPKGVKPGQKLELYIKHDCPYCAKARRYYDGKGIEYKFYDAQNDREVRKRMFALANGNPTVPAIVVDGTYVQSGWGSPPLG
jgi:thioredoxin reductase (NADPH)